MHLTLSLGRGGPDAPDAGALQAVVRAAERNKLDAVFVGVGGAGGIRFDPLSLMGSMIGITQRIGLAASWTVEFTEPYHVARVFATLDHLSYGRSAWFVDMFDTERLLPLIGKPQETDDTAAYCARAAEFITVVKALWDSWEDEGFALDKATGMFADPDRVHPINHAGRFFAVRGPLNVPRPPQGTPPLIMRDPADDAARAFVAKYADIILTDDASSEHVRALRALADGRDIRVLTNLRCTLGETEAAASQQAAASSTPSSDCFIGTPTQLVDHFRTCASDGFNLLTDDIDLLIEVTLPLAQLAGLIRTEYRGITLREHFGLHRPRSQFTPEGAA
jgi:alkanesulfonate monooxygenase SsuD/methylene tetrahydromethanopterin reductase-like flavin-dependent oxidoreductase (luciferase family)